MPDRSSDNSTYLLSKNGNGKEVNNRNGDNNYVYSLPVVNQPQTEAEGDSIDLRQLTNIVKHRLRLIGAVTAGVTAITALFTFYQVPQYQGVFQLLVEPVSEDPTNPFEENPLSILQQDLGGLDYDSQIEVLRSPRVLDPIISRLSSKYPELEYKELIKLKKSPLKIEQIDETKILEVSYTDPDPKKIQFVLKNLSNAYLRYSLEEKRAKVQQGVEFVERQLPQVRKQVDDLQGKVQTFRQKYNLLDPEQQAGLLAEEKVSLEQKLFDTQAQIKETNASYTLLQKQLGLEPQQALAASYLSESPRYQNLLSELQLVEVELAQESTRFSANNPVVQSLEEKKAKLARLLQQEAGNVLGNNLASSVDNTPNLTSPSTLRLELNQQYIKAANEIQILGVRERTLNQGLSQVIKLTKQMPIVAREYTDLMRELTVATESLTRFLTAQEELELQGAQQALPWQEISRPQLLEDPVSPNPARNIILGLLSGVLLGIGAALLAERLDPVFHSSEELKESVKLPILGLVPIQKELKPLSELINGSSQKAKSGLPQLQIGNKTISLSQPSESSQTSVVNSNQTSKPAWSGSSPFLESFRSLNTNIRLLGSDTAIRTFVISSSIPSEGKSTISCHLAQAAAAMGQRVLIIDADLRRPQVHRWIGVENKKGLSNILATGSDLEDAIVKVPERENLSIITAGDIPPDPTRLLSSQKMYALMEQLKTSQKYDLIIYDTPPILGFADGTLLSSHTDGVVLVVRIGKTDRTLLKQNIDNIRMSNVPILGIVANQVSLSSGSYHYYSQYYSERK